MSVSSKLPKLFSVCLLAMACGPVLAQTPARALTPQQQRMSSCNQTATGKTGDERKTYMSHCLKGEAPAPAVSTSQQRMKDCNAKAGEQSLKGDARKTFMSQCLKSSTPS